MFFSLCLLSFLSSVVFGISIPRINTVFCASWLVYCGYVLKQRIKMNFDNPFLLLASILLVYEIVLVFGGVSLATNEYTDVVILTTGTIAVLYILSFLGKKIESSMVGSFLAFCGRDSYSIMALHLLGFKIASLFLIFVFDIGKPLDEWLSPAASVAELLFYIVVAICFSLLLSFFIRIIKMEIYKGVCHLIKVCKSRYN